MCFTVALCVFRNGVYPEVQLSLSVWMKLWGRAPHKSSLHLRVVCVYGVLLITVFFVSDLLVCVWLCAERLCVCLWWSCETERLMPPPRLVRNGMISPPAPRGELLRSPCSNSLWRQQESRACLVGVGRWGAHCRPYSHRGLWGLEGLLEGLQNPKMFSL